jgi:hypothetical protein
MGKTRRAPVAKFGSGACIQNRTAAQTAERELSQLAAATLATGARVMKFRAEVAWRRAADWDNPRSGSFLKTRLNLLRGKQPLTAKIHVLIFRAESSLALAKSRGRFPVSMNRSLAARSWTAPAERSGDDAFGRTHAGLGTNAGRAKTVSRSACHRSP